MNKMNVRNLSFIYPGRLHRTLDDVSFEIKEGKVTGLFGPNGSGKTTLLKCITGFNKIGKNTILLGDGTDLSTLSIRERSQYISFVSQEQYLNMPFTVREVVMMGLESYSRSMYPSKEDIERTGDVISSFGLDGIAEDCFTELSGGQKQMVSIARAVNQDSEYIFLDEPVSNLDFSNAHTIWRKLSALNSAGKTIVVSSHDPNHIMKYCDEVALVHRGRIMGIGSPKDVLTPETMEIMFGMKVNRRQVDEDWIILPTD